MLIRVSLVYSPAARQVFECHLELEQGAEASGVLRAFPGLDLSQGGVGVWGHKASPSQVLRERDRIEIYRPLVVDPKVARRERFRKQGARSAGLFARRREGGKAGY
jgi:putative ubiquitin-RnfH superfamily antitoxin RatB of RatAB toxin-antitoxin module